MKFSVIRRGLLLYDGVLITYAEALKLISDGNLRHPLYIMSKYKNDWYSARSEHDTQDEKEEKPVGKLPLSEWEEVLLDINTMQAKIRSLLFVPYGTEIHIKGEDLRYTISDRILRYFIATRSLKSGPLEYLIFDTVGGICGPFVMPHIPYAMDKNLDDPTNRVKILEDLESGMLRIVGNMKIADVVDLESAIKTIPHNLGWP